MRYHSLSWEVLFLVAATVHGFNKAAFNILDLYTTSNPSVRFLQTTTPSTKHVNKHKIIAATTSSDESLQHRQTKKRSIIRGSNKQQHNETEDSIVAKNDTLNSRQRLLLLAESVAKANLLAEQSSRIKHGHSKTGDKTQQMSKTNSKRNNIMDRGLVRLSGDSMSASLGYNSLNWRDYASSNNVWHVAILFGKLLVSHHVTLEYAARIRTLAELLLVKDEPLFRPSLIFFCGDTRRSLSYSNSSTDVASAGCEFFEQLCTERNVNLEGIQIIKDTTSKNEGEVVQFVTREVKKYLPTWFEQAATAAMEEVGTTTKSSFPKQTKVKVHFTIISTAYHLSNLNDIHNRSPKQSCMKSIEKLQEDVTKSLAAVNRRAFLENYYYTREKKQSFASGSPTTSSYNKSSEEYFDECIDDICYYNEVEGHHQDDDTVESHDFEEGVEENDREFFQTSSSANTNKQIPEVMRQGVLETSWSFQYATYPYIRSSDEVVAFLGNIFLLGEALVPLLVNMKGVVQKVGCF